MNDKSPKQISRRDAIKLLGAVAGASVLANLPGKWNKPELTSGVLPAHAQTSVAPPTPTNPAPTNHTLVAGPDSANANFCQPLSSTVTITPATPGIVMRYLITTVGAVSVTSPALNGTVPTDASGIASLSITTNPASVAVGDTITVTWSFENASDGSGSDSQVFTSTAACGGGHTLAAGADDPNANFCAIFTSTVKITPNTPGIAMRYVITTNGSVSVTSPALNGTVTTDGSGASLSINTDPASVAVGDTVTVTWSFANASDGSGSDAQVFTSAAVCKHTLVAGADTDVTDCGPTLLSTVTISPSENNTPMHYVISQTGNATINPLIPLVGTQLTNGSGIASLSITFVSSFETMNGGNTVTVTWTFENASDGDGSDAQVFTSKAAC